MLKSYFFIKSPRYRQKLRATVDPIFFFFPLITFFAFVVKMVTGFGSAIILMALGSLCLEPSLLLSISSILDGVAGFFMLSVVQFRKHWRFWLPPGGMMIGGAILGSVFLQVLPVSFFYFLLNFFIVGLSFWFLRKTSAFRQEKLFDSLPPSPTKGDLVMAFIAGLCGGLLGMSGPPLIWHFGHKFSKEPFRQAIVPILFLGTVSRFLTYLFLGVVPQEVFFYLILAVPGMILGIGFGKFLFHRISEVRFRQMIGILLISIVLLNILKKWI